MSKKNRKVRAEIIKYNGAVKKAETPQNINPEEHSLCEWIPQPPLKGLEVMTENSSILPQCIAAYKASSKMITVPGRITDLQAGELVHILVYNSGKKYYLLDRR